MIPVNVTVLCCKVSYSNIKSLKHFRIRIFPSHNIFFYPIIPHWLKVSQFSISLKIRVWFYILKLRFHLKINFLCHFSHGKLWSCYQFYIDNLYRVLLYRTIGHLSEKISKKILCRRLNNVGYTAVSACVILLH